MGFSQSGAQTRASPQRNGGEGKVVGHVPVADNTLICVWRDTFIDCDMCRSQNFLLRNDCGIVLSPARDEAAGLNDDSAC